MTLKVVEPIEITEAVLTASDIPEPDTARGEVEWVPDRESLILLSEKSSSGASYTVDAATDGVNIFALEGFGFYGSSAGLNCYIHKYDIDGVFSGTSFFVDSLLSSIEVFDGNIYCASVGGFVRKYDMTGALVETFDVSQSCPNPVGICNGGGRFCLLDKHSSSVIGYNSAFNADGFLFEISGSPLSVYGLKFEDGIFYTTNQASSEIAKINSSGEDISYPIIINNDSVSVDFGGVFFIGDYTYSINSNDSNAYRYNEGIYDGLYKPEDRVIKTSTHKLYQCLIATSQDPEEGATGDSIATWIEVGPTNKWAMFDDQNSTTTKSSGSFSVELESSDYIMAYGVTGSSGLTSVRCQVYDSGSNLIYDDTQSAFDNVGAPGDFIYASEDVFYKKKLYQTDIPPTENFKAVFTFNGSDIEIGNLTVGPAIELGPCLSDSKNESLDLSEQVFDDFGNETYTERPIITFATYETISSIENSNIINRFLNVIRRKGCLWIGEVGYNQSIVTFGRIERDPIPYTMPTEIRYTIRVRGFA